MPVVLFMIQILTNREMKLLEKYFDEFKKVKKVLSEQIETHNSLQFYNIAIYFIHEIEKNIDQ